MFFENQYIFMCENCQFATSRLRELDLRKINLDTMKRTTLGYCKLKTACEVMDLFFR